MDGMLIGRWAAGGRDGADEKKGAYTPFFLWYAVSLPELASRLIVPMLPRDASPSLEVEERDEWPYCPGALLLGPTLRHHSAGDPAIAELEALQHPG